MKFRLRTHGWLFMSFLVIAGRMALFSEAQAAETSTLYFAQMADGGGYITQIILANPRNVEVTATVELYQSNGSPLTITLNSTTHHTFSYTIKALGSLFLKSSGAGSQVHTGWVRVKSATPLSGSLTYSYLSGSKVLSEGGMDPSTPTNQFCFPVDARYDYYTGLALVNPGTTALDLQFLLYTGPGYLRSSARRRLDGFHHEAKLIEEIFPQANLNNFTGTVYVFSAGGPVAATTLRFDVAVGTLASIPVSAGITLLEAGTLFSVDSVVGNLRYVPAGTFVQGSPDTEPGRYPGEGPQFEHTLTRNMAVMETEITRQMWADLRSLQPGLPEDPTNTNYGSGMSQPAQSVTWFEAVLFANLLSKQHGLTPSYYQDSTLTIPINSINDQTNGVFVNWDGNGFRLPTEGEWEYFTRAGTTGPFSVKETAYSLATLSNCERGTLTVLEAAAWFCANASAISHPAGLKDANPWGLKDVHGNVLEWCWDRHATSYPSSSRINYSGPSTGTDRVFRSGSWGSYPRQVRSAYRNVAAPGQRANALGFRLLRSIP